ncbi:MAG: Crp/Fnr family transcriptional regulator [Sphingomonas sp.]
MTRTVDDALDLYLARLALRSPLGDAERAALLSLPAEAKVVGVERDFVRIGDRVDHACLVVDGLVARFAQIRNGMRSFVALHIPGDMADLHSVVAPHVTWALHALTATTILRIPHCAIRLLADRFPALAMAFWRDCVVDANVLAQWTVNISRKDALSRVAHLLAEMDARYAAIGLKAGDSYPFPVTQADLADAVGLTSVHLNRVLRRLRDDGLATKHLESVTVSNRPALARAGEFDPAYLQLDCDDRDHSH